MPPTVVVDELHLTVRMPADLPAGEAEAVRRTLAELAFLDHVRAAVLAVVREYPTLAPVAVTASR
ncbi:hypothetical protein [Urbifossiella limnaea]|uniref:Uncharacterized protein n=1 Tax=Urbifossiella limnaea TaxID=2528023 RepID=A0A517XW47_9BACT|nr:hypothetical protein [Urbifossiella limnaea]QDU21731.1 hypothetical protein ETAA1_37040 [Urbifossiella limnaea]